MSPVAFIMILLQDWTPHNIRTVFVKNRRLTAKTRHHGQKGTVLDGRDSFNSWKMDTEDSLSSDDLTSYVIGDATAELSGFSTGDKKSATDIKNMSLARMKIRQSIDQTHKSSVNHLTDPREIYRSLVNRYATSNKARLWQLIRMMYDVSTQTNRTVQEEVDDLKRLRAQINSQDKDCYPWAALDLLLANEHGR